MVKPTNMTVDADSDSYFEDGNDGMDVDEEDEEERMPLTNGNGPIQLPPESISLSATRITTLLPPPPQDALSSSSSSLLSASTTISPLELETSSHHLPPVTATTSSFNSNGSSISKMTMTASTSTAGTDDEASGDEELSSFMESYDWEKEKLKKNQFFDDGTMSFFWRAHTLTTLFLLIVVLVYVALVEKEVDNSEYNTKRGMIAVFGFFVLMGVTVIPDGPFLRPHPAFWRLMFCLSIVYFLSLIYLLFQSADDARKLLRLFDPKLGYVLEERSYGGNCRIYDSDVPDDPFHNVWDKFDLFVPLHFFGWWLKTLILRDWWICTVISIMFEILEYTLEHQLPNFSECWWDHWVLDAMLCNGVGILVGMKTLKYFRVRTYYWRGLWTIPGYKGKLKRILAQFGPHSWIEFDWKPTSTMGRWIATLGITFAFLVAELNTFYLKFVLWVPPGHWLNLVRLFAILFWGAVCLRETFQYLDDPQCKSFGRQSWMMLAIISTEFLIVAKFDPVTITKPIPGHIALFWLIGIFVLAVWTILTFGFYRRVDEKLNTVPPITRSDSHASILRKRTTSNSGSSSAPRNKSSFNVHFRPKSQ